MPKNFDEILNDDRVFVIGGESFTWQNVHWRTFAKWFDDAVTPNGDGKEGEEADDTVVSSLESVVERILLYLDPSDRERFKSVVEREDNPVTVLQLNELASWLLEEQTTRPTQPPSPSPTGRGRTARTSPGGSRSPGVTQN